MFSVTAIVEQGAAIFIEASVSLLKEPGQVLVLLADGPNEARVVLLDGVENILGDVAELIRLGDI